MIEGGIDEGDIVEQRLFDLDAGRDGADPEHQVLRRRDRQLRRAGRARSRPAARRRVPQDLDAAHLLRPRRPAARAAARLDFRRDAGGSGRPGPRARPRRLLEPARPPEDRRGRPAAAGRRGRGRANPAAARCPARCSRWPTTRLVVATGSAPCALGRLTDMAGAPVPPRRGRHASATCCRRSTAAAAEALTAAMAALAPGEAHWRRRLRGSPRPSCRRRAPAGRRRRAVARIPLDAARGPDRRPPARRRRAPGSPASAAGRRFDLAYRDAAIAAPPRAPGYVAGWVPVRFDAGGETLRAPPRRPSPPSSTLARRHGSLRRSTSPRATPRSRRGRRPTSALAVGRDAADRRHLPSPSRSPTPARGAALRRRPALGRRRPRRWPRASAVLAAAVADGAADAPPVDAPAGDARRRARPGARRAGTTPRPPTTEPLRARR